MSKTVTTASARSQSSQDKPQYYNLDDDNVSRLI